LTDLEQFINEGIVRKPVNTVLSKFSLPMPVIQQNQYQYRHEARRGEKNQPESK
jgi:hypothetical protein